MNQPLRKPNSNSLLQTLPEERQEELFEMLKVKSIRAVKSHLAKDGIAVSLGALHNFFSWFQLRRQFKQNRDDVSTLLDQLKSERPAMSEEQIFAYGQQLFSLLAVKNQDSESWTWIQKTRQREELINIERQKFRRETCKLFIEWVADEEAKEIATSTSSNADKIEALGKKMFGEDWE